MEAIIGMIVGAVAKLLMPGRDPGGIWVTMILGIAGSIVATYLGIWASLLAGTGKAGRGLHYVGCGRDPAVDRVPSDSEHAFEVCESMT